MVAGAMHQPSFAIRCGRKAHSLEHSEYDIPEVDYCRTAVAMMFSRLSPAMNHCTQCVQFRALVQASPGTISG